LWLFNKKIKTDTDLIALVKGMETEDSANLFLGQAAE